MRRDHLVDVHPILKLHRYYSLSSTPSNDSEGSSDESSAFTLYFISITHKYAMQEKSSGVKRKKDKENGKRWSSYANCWRLSDISPPNITFFPIKFVDI